MSVAMKKILSCPDLPTLPAIAVQVLEMTRDPDVGLPEIARLVQNDTGLSAKFLRTVNSSFVGLSTPCTAIDRALGLLGMSAVKSLVLGFSLLECTSDIEEAEGFSLQRYWRRVVYGATASRQFSRLFDTCDSDEAFTAGLFQDMGMLTAHVALGRDYDRVVASAPRVHTPLVEVEQSELGFTHAEVGAQLASRWKLPPSIVACIEHHHAPDASPEEYRDLVRLICLGRMAAQSMSDETPGEEFPQLLSLCKEWFDHHVEDISDMLAVFETVAEASQDLSKVFNRDIGAVPDVETIMAEANEALIGHQLQMAQETEHLRIVSVTDQLTGASNRKKFDSVLVDCFEASKMNGMPFAVLFSDADRFKSVNDTYGHAAGDRVLVELSQRLRDTIGDDGEVFRYGGEEFAILLPGRRLEDGIEIGERVREAIASAPFDLRGIEGAPDELPVTVSVGVSASDPDAPRHANGDAVVHEADEAVYRAKHDGRNCVRAHGIDAEASDANAEVEAPDAITDPTAVLDASNDATASEPASIEATTPEDSIDESSVDEVPDTSPTSDEAPEVVTEPPSEAAGAEAGSEAENLAPGSVRVLLVEDDPLASKLMQFALEKRRVFAVTAVETGDEARAILRRIIDGEIEPPDVLLTDINLPGCSGLTLIREFRRAERTKDVPAMVVSATTDEGQIAAIEASDVERFFNKMHIVTNMTDWLGDLLELSRLARERRAA